MFLILYFFGILGLITSPIIEVVSALIVNGANYIVLGVLKVIVNILR